MRVETIVVQIALGGLLVFATTWVAAFVVTLGEGSFLKHSRLKLPESTPLRIAYGLSFMMAWFIGALFVVVAVWSIAFLALGVFNTFEEALYFSLVTFTTLGFGDILLPQGWRLLSGFLAAEGLLLFGLCTALVLDLLQKLEISN